MGQIISHYFVNDTELKPNIKSFEYNFHENKFSFLSDSGIFSIGHVDFATNLLLNIIPPISGTLLDMGCGYGVIGIVLAKIYNVQSTLADINDKALEFSNINCINNNVIAKIIKSDCFNNIDENFDNIIINPPIHAGKNTIFNMYENSYAHLNYEGSLYVVIQKKHGAESSIKKLSSIFNHCNILYKKKGYYILNCKKNIY